MPEDAFSLEYVQFSDTLAQQTPMEMGTKML